MMSGLLFKPGSSQESALWHLLGHGAAKSFRCVAQSGTVIGRVAIDARDGLALLDLGRWDQGLATTKGRTLVRRARQADSGETKATRSPWRTTVAPLVAPKSSG